MEYNVVDNKEKSRFEIELDGDFAHVDYRWYHEKLAIMHTEVPEANEGKGIAAIMVKHVLDYARKEGLKILVYCPYTAKYIKRHPEYQDLVAKL
jgi:predicted GNAT family acetyltransferase